MKIQDVTRGMFIDWLKKFPLEHEIGVACRSKLCPIYNFLSFLGFNVSGVSSLYIRLYGVDEYFDTPQWMANFINQVDLNDYDVPISAEIALTILEKYA